MAAGVAETEHHGTRRRVLALHGDLDVAASTSVLKRLIELDLRPGQRLLLDLRDVQFIDSTGIRLLLQARGVLPGSPASVASQVQVVTPYNEPAHLLRYDGD